MNRSIRKTLILIFLFFVLISFWYFSANLSILFKDSGAQTSIKDDPAEKSVGNQEILAYTHRIGKELYGTYCQVCHGATGEGDGFNAYNLSPRPRNFKEWEYITALSDSRLREAIREGGRGVNRSVLMPAWGKTFSELEIGYLVQYIRQFSTKNENKSIQP